MPFILLCFLFACKKEESNFNPDQNITYTSYYKLGSGQDTVYSFYIPNAYTPNGDALNDIFNGRGKGIDKFRMEIFDKWGSKGFVSDDFNAGWYGHFNGGKDIAPNGTYSYRFEITNIFGENFVYTGQVALIR